MSTLVVYESMWGNTRAVAEAVARGLGEGVTTSPAEPGIREWLAQLPASDHLDVATFDTRVGSVRHLPGSAARTAGKEVRRHHLGRLVATMSFYVGDMAGPLLDGEVERAHAWGRSLAGPRVGGTPT